MTDYQITNVQELLGAVKICGQRFNNAQMWWRGHAQAKSWLLRPAVFRAENYQPGKEKNMVGHFVARARTRHSDCPDHDRTADWLFLMQHYGLSTRILDWTQSVLVAAYFVARDESQYQHDGTIWAVAPALLNNNQTGKRVLHSPETHPAVKMFKEAFQGGEQEPQGPTVAVVAPEFDIRMLVQRSAFTIHGSRTALEDLPDHDDFLQKFTIPSAAKPQLKAIVNAFGYSEANLFPDLEHLAKEVRSLNFDL